MGVRRKDTGGPVKKAPAKAKRVTKKATKAPIEQHGPGEPWKNRNATQITPFASKAHHNVFHGFDADLAVLRKAETIHKHGSWDAVPFIKPGGPSWTPGKAIAAYASAYKKHRMDGKNHTTAHCLAGQHSTLFDSKGRSHPHYAEHGPAAKAAGAAAHKAAVAKAKKK